MATAHTKRCWRMTERIQEEVVDGRTGEALRLLARALRVYEQKLQDYAAGRER